MSVKGLGCTLLFIGFAKVLDVPFGYHLGKMLMIFVVDDMEEERLCHTVNLNFIIAYIEELLLSNVSLEHGREHTTTVFLNRHVLLVARYKMYEVAKVTQYYVRHPLHQVGYTLFYLVEYFVTSDVLSFYASQTYLDNLNALCIQLV